MKINHFFYFLEKRTMYKKLSLWLLIFGIIFSIPFFAKADIQDVSFRFCDDTNNTAFLAWKKNISVTPGVAKELCMNFTTTSEVPRQITYGFTKWIVGKSWIQVCDANKWPNNVFSKYLTTTGSRTFVITKSQPKTVREKMVFPIGTTGTQYWCLAYSLATPDATGLAWIFNLVVNKVFPLIVSITK